MRTRIACGHAPAEADYAHAEALIDSLEAIETAQARYAVSFNQAVGRRRRMWATAELDRLRGLASALQTDAPSERQALSSLAVENSDPEMLQEDLHAYADLFESRLEQIDATTVEPARSRRLVEAILTGRSVVAARSGCVPS